MSFPKVLYNLPSRTYGGALQFLKSLNAHLAKHQKREKGLLAPNINDLKNTDNLYELIGRPLDVIPTIHVAGTNGKGSTSFKIAEGLKYSGYRTGLCMGPHISSFRERMQVNGQLVSETEVVDLLDTVINLCTEHKIPATFFEIAFIMTCLHFQTMKCDVVVLEVGMGGRYDASNVISSYMAVVTSIGLDHTYALGNTVELIAAHKAGIFKPNTPALVGPQCPLSVMQDEAARKNSALHTLYSYMKDSSLQGLIPALTDHPLLNIPPEYTSTTFLKESSFESTLSLDEKKVMSSEDSPSLLSSSSPITQPLHSSDGDYIFDADRLCSQLALASLCLLKHYPPRPLNDSDSVSDSDFKKLSSQNIFSSQINLHDINLLNLLYNNRLPCRFEELIVEKSLVNHINDDGIDRSLESERPSRNIRVKVILDVAHNIPSLSVLMEKVNRQFGSNVRVIMGITKGKGTEYCLRTVTKYVSSENIDFIQSDNERAISVESLYEAVGSSRRCGYDTSKEGHVFNFVDSLGIKSNINHTYNTIHSVLDQIMRKAVQEKSGIDVDGLCSEVLVISGTLYAMPHVRRSLGIIEPNDALDVKVTV